MHLTYQVAHSAGWGAGNRSAMKNGRTVWNEDDYNESVRVMNELLDNMKVGQD